MSEQMTIGEAKTLLREHAFTTEDGRTIIHCRLSGLGADWDLANALALVERSTDRGWIDSFLGHNLGVLADDRVYAFDVPRPSEARPGV